MLLSYFFQVFRRFTYAKNPPRKWQFRGKNLITHIFLIKYAYPFFILFIVMKAPNRGRKKLADNTRRITVILDEKTFGILNEIKELSGESYGGQVRDFLIDMTPAFEIKLQTLRVKQALDNASKEDVKRAVEGFEARFQKIEKSAENLLGETNQQLDMFARTIRSRRSSTKKSASDEVKKTAPKRGGK